MSKALQIAIDGPASAGKSTVAKLVAKKLHYVYCDTGAMYRAVTWQAMALGLDLTDEPEILKVVKTYPIRFVAADPVQQVFIGDQDVTTAIRQPNVTNNVSTVAALASVRAALVEQQRAIADQGGIVMDGRDIGTTVLPQAQVKIFLVASVAERARRRYEENLTKGINTPLATLEHEIEVRDHKDSTRKVSPLTQAKDATRLDTTPLSIDEVVAEIYETAKKKEKDSN